MSRVLSLRLRTASGLSMKVGRIGSIELLTSLPRQPISWLTFSTSKQELVAVAEPVQTTNRQELQARSRPKGKSLMPNMLMSRKRKNKRRGWSRFEHNKAGPAE